MLLSISLCATLPLQPSCDEAERCLLVEVRVAEVAPPRSERELVKDIAIGLYIYQLVVAVLGLPAVVASLPSRKGCDEAERCLLVEVRVAKVAPPRSEGKVVKDVAIGLYIYRLVVAVLGLPAVVACTVHESEDTALGSEEEVVCTIAIALFVFCL